MEFCGKQEELIFLIIKLFTDQEAKVTLNSKIIYNIHTKPVTNALRSESEKIQQRGKT